MYNCEIQLFNMVAIKRLIHSIYTEPLKRSDEDSRKTMEFFIISKLKPELNKLS